MRSLLVALVTPACSLLLVPPAPPRPTPPEPVACGSRIPAVADALVALPLFVFGAALVRYSEPGIVGFGVILLGGGIGHSASSAIGFYRVHRCRDERERFIDWAARQPPPATPPAEGELGGACGAPRSRWEAGSCRPPLACDGRTATCGVAP